MNTVQHKIIYLFLVSLLFSTPASARDKIEETGDILQILIPTIAYGTTFYIDDKEGRKQFHKSFLSTVVATHSLKNIINKKRPNGSDKSFPSGHTSAAFQGAAFIHKRYGIKYAIPAYLGASYVGYSRVKSDNHYTEDVLAGAIIGIASNLYFTKKYKQFVVTPIANKNFKGFNISRSFK